MVADKGTDKEEQRDGDYNIQGPTQRLLNARNWQREKETAIAQGMRRRSKGSRSTRRPKTSTRRASTTRPRRRSRSSPRNATKSYETWQVRWDNWIGVKNAAKWDPYSNFGDPIEEDSLFMLAECQFAQSGTPTPRTPTTTCSTATPRRGTWTM